MGFGEEEQEATDPAPLLLLAGARRSFRRIGGGEISSGERGRLRGGMMTS